MQKPTFEIYCPGCGELLVFPVPITNIDTEKDDLLTVTVSTDTYDIEHTCETQDEDDL